MWKENIYWIETFPVKLYWGQWRPSKFLLQEKICCSLRVKTRPSPCPHDTPKFVMYQSFRVLTEGLRVDFRLVFTIPPTPPPPDIFDYDFVTFSKHDMTANLILTALYASAKQFLSLALIKAKSTHRAKR